MQGINITFPTSKTAKVTLNGKVIIKKCKVEEVEIKLKQLGLLR